MTGPSEATATESSPTRAMVALQNTKEARGARREAAGLSEMQLWILAIVRNLLLGAPFACFGFWRLFIELRALDKMPPEWKFHFVDLIRFIPAAGLLLVAYAFFAPAHVEFALRFVGLGNIIDRLPFLRPRNGNGALPPAAP